MQYYIIILSVYVSLILPINSCTLYINIIIHCKKKCSYFLMTVRCTIDGQRYIPFFIMPGYMTILNYYVTYHLNVQVINIVQSILFSRET